MWLQKVQHSLAAIGILFKTALASKAIAIDDQGDMGR